MKAIRIAAPATLDTLHHGDVADPGAPGSGEIRVALSASSLNFHDFAVVTGMIPAADGRIPMSDGAGTVEAGGGGGPHFNAGGDRGVDLFLPPARARPASAGALVGGGHGQGRVPPAPGSRSPPRRPTPPARTSQPEPMRASLRTVAPMPTRLSSPTEQPCTMAPCPTVTRCPTSAGLPASLVG